MGNNSVTLTKTNLPNPTYSVTTQTTGAHTHTYLDRGSGQIQSTEGGLTRDIVDDIVAVSKTTSTAIDHTHTYTVSTGGSDTPIDITPLYLATNVFIYLGK
ncbi:hypothetical protein ACTS94_02875 [Empedobacter falsenii]